MAGTTVIKPDGTIEITYNDNKQVKIEPTADILTNKCPHAHCPAAFLSQDDLNNHRIVEHGELPKNLFDIPKPPNQKKYFKRASVYRMSGAIQRESLKHALLAIGINIYGEGSLVKKLLKKGKR
jgi:hypothetical protein